MLFLEPQTLQYGSYFCTAQQFYLPLSTCSEPSPGLQGPRPWRWRVHRDESWNQLLKQCRSALTLNTGKLSWKATRGVGQRGFWGPSRLSSRARAVTCSGRLLMSAMSSPSCLSTQSLGTHMFWFLGPQCYFTPTISISITFTPECLAFRSLSAGDFPSNEVLRLQVCTIGLSEQGCSWKLKKPQVSIRIGLLMFSPKKGGDIFQYSQCLRALLLK